MASLAPRPDQHVALASPRPAKDYVATLLHQIAFEQLAGCLIYDAFAPNGDVPQLLFASGAPLGKSTTTIAAPTFCARLEGQLANYELIVGLCRYEDNKLAPVRISDVWPKQWGKVTDLYCLKLALHVKKAEVGNMWRMDVDPAYDQLDLGKDLVKGPLHAGKEGDDKHLVADAPRLWKKGPRIVHYRLVQRGCKHWQQMLHCECEALSFAYELKSAAKPPAPSAESDANSKSSDKDKASAKRKRPEAESSSSAFEAALEVVKKQNAELNERNEHLTAVLSQLATRYIADKVHFELDDKVLLDAICAVLPGGQVEEVKPQ